MALNYRTGQAYLVPDLSASAEDHQQGRSKKRMIPIYGLSGKLLAFADNEALAREIAELLQGVYEIGDNTREKACDMGTNVGRWRSNYYARQACRPYPDEAAAKRVADEFYNEFKD
jgi:hypothetical protein